MNKNRFHVVALAILCLCAVTRAQDRFSARLISKNYRAAIVRIQVVALNRDTQKQVLVDLGTGFIVASNVIITANHVVTYSDSPNYLPNIQAELSDGKTVKAMPIFNAPSTESKLHDYAVLRTVEPLNSPTLQLGSWKDTEEADQLTTIGYALNLLQPVLLSVSVAALFPENGIDVIVFQGPNNKGLSGAPLISNRTGKVVGIVTSRLVGISPQLAELRSVGSKGGGAKVDGLSPSEAVVAITNVLDAYLTSGMGAAIAIDYAAASVPRK
jgi:hypothetical protein